MTGEDDGGGRVQNFVGIGGLLEVFELNAGVKVLFEQNFIGLKPKGKYGFLFEPRRVAVELELEQLLALYVRTKTLDQIGTVQVQVERYARALVHVGRKITIVFLIVVEYFQTVSNRITQLQKKPI